MDSESKNSSVTQEDIFDKIMSLPVLKFLNPFYKKNKEILLYLFFGGLSFVVSVATYYLFNVVYSLDALIANVLSWIITVMFAFLTNRIWVFAKPTKTMREFITQMISFYAGRVVTLIIEEIILGIGIDLCGCNSILVKIIAQVVVIILNYVISKAFIFKKNHNIKEAVK